MSESPEIILIQTLNVVDSSCECYQQYTTNRGIASHFFPLSPFKKMISLDNSVQMSYS